VEVDLGKLRSSGGETDQMLPHPFGNTPTEEDMVKSPRAVAAVEQWRRERSD
jgi:hypothetical protein